MQGGLRAGCARLLRARVHVVRLREQGADGRRDEGGMQEGLQRAWPFSVDRVPAVDGLIQPDAECHLPAHAVQVSDLPRPDPWGEIRQEKAVPLRGLHPYEAQRQCVAAPTDMHIGVNDPAIEDQDLLLTQYVEVSPWEELLRDLPARPVVHLRLPVRFQADDTLHAVG